MIFRNVGLLFTILITALLGSKDVQAIEAPKPSTAVTVPAPRTYNAPPIEKITAGIYRIGEVIINKKEKSVTFPAQVNMDKGMLEYLLVYRAGKTHESLLRTNITPYTLQLAFTLLGYEGTDKRIERQGSPEIPKGESVRITVSNVDGKNSADMPVERWLANKNANSLKDVAELNWVFCGSFINNLGRFMSQETGSIIAIWHDPVAIIDNASPGGESNRIWLVKEGSVPRVGTPVTVTIKPSK